MHLAQLNVARMRAPLDDPSMADFVDNLERINKLGDASPGFVWRLQDDDGAATSYRPFDDDDIIVNLTVWESVAALRAYAYTTEHRDFLRRRREWFLPLDSPYLALWWLPEGELPTVEDAVARLAHLAERGPSERAFTFASVVEPQLVEER
jgi:heme-degrading monooxygenase HmoA